MSPSSRAASSLIKDPIISRSLNESLARMLRNVQERHFKAGEHIYRRASAAGNAGVVKRAVKQQVG